MAAKLPVVIPDDVFSAVSIFVSEIAPNAVSPEEKALAEVYETSMRAKFTAQQIADAYRSLNKY